MDAPVTKKILGIGSCLTSSALQAVAQDFKLFGVFHHLRSDFALDVLNGRDAGIPDDLVEPMNAFLLRFLDAGVPEPMLLRRLTEQRTRRMGYLRNCIRQADVVVIDSNYDFGRVLNIVTFQGKTFRLSNLRVMPSEFSTNTGLLSASEMIDCTAQLFEKLRELNPDAWIVYLNYPVTAFRKRASESDLRRVEMVRAMSEWLHSEYTAGRLPQKLVAIDCADVPDNMLADKGVLYFEDPFYTKLAKVIEAVMDGTWDGPSLIGNHAELQALFPDPASPTPAPVGTASPANPYADLPERQYWKPAVADPYPLAIKGLYSKRFDIAKSDAIATCGSCFAQHIGRRLAARGHNYLDMEPVPAGMPKAEAASLGYGIYSARYGNVYTSRQLLQLFKRAFGELSFDETWKKADGRYVDPFRPNLSGPGWDSAEEALQVQADHLEKVREMFQSLDIFVFTMGLTETWQNRQTGAAYPISPGVTAGKFDPRSHEFVNLDYQTILQEMTEFLSLLRGVNPNARVLLTVSPVPLTATAEDRHVLVSTMASKSILRAVADQIYRSFDNVDYFPSYDIVMSPPYKAMFFKSNLRSIHEEGVDHVMSHFFAEHGTGGNTEATPSDMDDEVFCDESFLELARKHGIAEEN